LGIRGWVIGVGSQLLAQHGGRWGAQNMLRPGPAHPGHAGRIIGMAGRIPTNIVS